MLGNTRFISVSCAHGSSDIMLFMFNTRNKSVISAHPCIILYIITNLPTPENKKPRDRNKKPRDVAKLNQEINRTSDF
jgi:hypothetical protein